MCVGATGFFIKYQGLCYQGLSADFIYPKWIYFAKGKGISLPGFRRAHTFERLMFA